MTDLPGWEWMFGRALASKVLGNRRRSRALRWALRAMVKRSVKEAGRAATPEDAAYHRGAHAVYSAVLLALDDTEEPPAEPPADSEVRASWQRGTSDAVEHSRQLAEQITGQQLPL